MALDRKGLVNTDALDRIVERTRQENRNTGEERRLRDNKTVLSDAFKSYQSPPGKPADPSQKSKGSDKTVLQNPPAPLNRSSETEPKVVAKEVNASGLSGSAPAKVHQEKGKITPDSPASFSANNVPATPQGRAASAYATAVVQPQLSDLLLKRANVPQSPEQAKKKEVGRTEMASAVEMHESVEPHVVAAPATLASGSRTADATARRDDPQSSFDNKGKKKSESKGATGGNALAKAQGRGAEGQKLEAASSGIASGGEPQWLADTEPGIYVVNPERPMDADLCTVLQRHRWYVDGILKRMPDRGPEVIEAVRKAVALDEDPELNRILTLGLAARKGPYGGTHA